MKTPLWVWQQPDWPHFSWQTEALAQRLRSCTQAQGRLLGLLGVVGEDVEQSLDTLLQNIVTSSAIEGEQLNAGSVRSSLARRRAQHALSSQLHCLKAPEMDSVAPRCCLRVRGLQAVIRHFTALGRVAGVVQCVIACLEIKQIRRPGRR